MRSCVGEKILKDLMPQHDAKVVIQLKEAGAVILGKTNMHEFAYGVTSNNPHYGPLRNPWDLARIPGGSSGGSAAGVAAGLCYGRMGTVTGCCLPFHPLLFCLAPHTPTSRPISR